MSIEYSSSVVLSEVDKTELVRFFQRDPRFRVVRLDEQELALRFSDHPEREEWPEDLRIQLAGGVAVSFDVATRQERTEFLAIVSDFVSAMGHTADFEES